MYRTIFLIVLLILSTVWAEDHAEYFDAAFKTPQDVTRACLECHEQAAEQVMQSSHWTWETPQAMLIPGHDTAVKLGKKNLFNNFCIAVESNWPRCTSCHVGYGWQDETFDFSNSDNVDCLVCHDQTGTYKKTPTGAGYPDAGVDLLAVAKSVGPSTRESCGNCHFYGGGGDNVKHGDLEPALINPNTNLDVHMGGQDMSCQECHRVTDHQIKGIAVSVTAQAQDRQVECTDCHEIPLHENETLDSHYDRIACQTCHIPEYAKELPTKIYWDWSTAGQDIEGKKDAFGKPLYDKKKGNFTWDKNIRPEYFWYNGNTGRYLAGDIIDPESVVQLNMPQGSPEDETAKIYPFKVHRGKQIADAEYNYLIVPKLFGGYWKHFDWNKAAEEGMKAAGLKYSGSYNFVETEMHWRVNHEISPKEKALQCMDCHGEKSVLNWQSLGYDGSPVSPEDIRDMMETNQ